MATHPYSKDKLGYRAAAPRNAVLDRPYARAYALARLNV